MNGTPYDKTHHLWELNIRVDVAKNVKDPSLAAAVAFRQIWDKAMSEYSALKLQGVELVGGEANRIDRQCGRKCRNYELVESYETKTVAREMAA